jgi:hypothetical protein
MGGEIDGKYKPPNHEKQATYHTVLPSYPQKHKRNCGRYQVQEETAELAPSYSSFSEGITRKKRDKQRKRNNGDARKPGQKIFHKTPEIQVPTTNSNLLNMAVPTHLSSFIAHKVPLRRCSASMDSNRALKLPLPKDLAPLR